jgi:CII-binding regulator of phage lambda lysogenization HflD
MRDPQNTRIVFGDFVDRIFWGLLVVVSSYGVVQIQSLSANVAKLNESMAVVLEKMSNTKDRMDRLEGELEVLKRHR